MTTTASTYHTNNKVRHFRARMELPPDPSKHFVMVSSFLRRKLQEIAATAPFNLEDIRDDDREALAVAGTLTMALQDAGFLA